MDVNINMTMSLKKEKKKKKKKNKYKKTLNPGASQGQSSGFNQLLKFLCGSRH